MSRGRQAWWLALLALACPLDAQAQRTPLGNEFQVNTYTSNVQRDAAVATDPDGDFVVIWSSAAEDLSDYGVFARRFSSAGAPVGSAFRVNTHTYLSQRSPAAAADADGDFVVAWWSIQDGSSYGVFARRFSSAGAPLTGEFQVNAHTTGNQRIVSVASDDEGDFVIVWSSYDNQDGSLYGVFARRYSSAGAALTDEFQINTYTVGFQRFPSTRADADGDFIVVWASNGQDGSSYGIFGRRFSSDGVALANEFQVNTFTSDAQTYPALALDADGDFVVVWRSLGQDGYQFGVFARPFSSAGTPLAKEFQVSTYTNRNERSSAVAMDAGGDFVVTWNSEGQELAENDVSARRFSSSGAPLTAVFRVNSYTPDHQTLPAVAAQAGGNFVVVWQSKLQDGDNYGIFAQRFAGLATLDVDGNGETEPLTDGLLVLRYLFGFTGNTITNGAVDLGACTRCDAAAIEPYLDGLGAILDVDDSGGMPEALTDGLLVLRFLFGFTGATLVNNTVDLGDCERCEATEILGYLAGLSA